MVTRVAEAKPEANATPLVVFSLDSQRYGLALTCVQRSIRVVAITHLPGAPEIVIGVVDLGGVVVPVINIRRRFNHAPRDVRLTDHLLIATTGTRTVALLVDETNGVLEVPAESYASGGEILSGLDLVDGAVKLEDGLVLIHNLERLLSLEEATAIDHALCVTNAGYATVNGIGDDKSESGPP